MEASLSSNYNFCEYYLSLYQYISLRFLKISLSTVTLDYRAIIIYSTWKETIEKIVKIIRIRVNRNYIRPEIKTVRLKKRKKERESILQLRVNRGGLYYSQTRLGINNVSPGCMLIPALFANVGRYQ